MARNKTASRVAARLREMTWPTAAELAAELHLSAGTVRTYLHELVVEGTVERREDESITNRAGGYASRFNVLAVPIGPPVPTDDLLCPGCIADVYRDEMRYRNAWSGKAMEEAEELDDDAYSQWLEDVRCARCGKQVYR